MLMKISRMRKNFERKTKKKKIKKAKFIKNNQKRMKKRLENFY